MGNREPGRARKKQKSAISYGKALKEYVGVLKERLPDCLEMSCPLRFEGIKVGHSTKAHLFLMPDKSPVFVLLSAPGITTSKLRSTLDALKRPAIALFIDPATNDVTAIGKRHQEHITFESISFSRLNNFLKANNMNPKQPEEKATSNLGGGVSTMDDIKQIRPEQAAELENYVNQLVHGLTSSPKNTDSEILQEAARAALRILPYTSREQKLAKAAISAMARTIVFLSPPERLKAVRSILELSLDDGIGLEIKERLASVALAVASSLNQEGLAQIVRDLRPRLGANEKTTPSFAQIISLVQARPQKI